MNLEKLFGGKVKVDIIKYLLFKRQGVSIRALEKDTCRSFPAIKKQIDLLEEAGILLVDKNSDKWSIYIIDHLFAFVKKVFQTFLLVEMNKLISAYVKEIYVGKFFGQSGVDFDMVVLYKSDEKERLEDIKKVINDIAKAYFIDSYLKVAYMSDDDFDKRYRMADKFALSVLKGAKPARDW